jgi:hypothetical protein
MTHTTEMIVRSDDYTIQGKCACGWRGAEVSMEESTLADEETNAHELGA